MVFVMLRRFLFQFCVVLVSCSSTASAQDAAKVEQWGLFDYALTGPKDGNPIGLGLLMCLGWLVGAVLIAWGAVGLVISKFRGNDN